MIYLNLMIFLDLRILGVNVTAKLALDLAVFDSYSVGETIVLNEFS